MLESPGGYTKKWRREKHFKSNGNASDCPGGAVYGNLPVSAGDTDSFSGPGGLHKLYSYWACAPGLLSTHPRAQELQRLKPTYRERVVHNKRGHHIEKSEHHNEEYLPQIEKTGWLWEKPFVLWVTGRWLWTCGKASLSPGTFIDRIHHRTEYECGDLWLLFPH